MVRLPGKSADMLLLFRHARTHARAHGRAPTHARTHACAWTTGLRQSFRYSRTQYQKPKHLIKLLRKSDAGRPGQRTIVFCHNAAAARFVEKFIAESCVSVRERA